MKRILVVFFFPLLVGRAACLTTVISANELGEGNVGGTS